MAEAVPGLHPGLRVERLTPDAWRAARDVRLAALIDSPRAFWTRYAEDASRPDEEWRERAGGPAASWLAWDGDRPVGTVTLWRPPDLAAGDVYLVGMWVAPPARGSGVAAALVEAALGHARGTGLRQVLLDVARENVRACRFYLRRGFVLTGETGVMPWDPTCVEERMVLDLT